MHRTNIMRSIPKLTTIALFFIIAFVFNSTVTAETANNSIEVVERVKITLEVVEVYDTRLPTLSETDVQQILDETKRMFSAKLGMDSVELDFHDNGVITFFDLFKGTKYRTKKNLVYQNANQWKYNFEHPEEMLLTDNYKENVIKFLQRWDLASLETFFPDKKINTYDDVYENLMKTYHSKIKWLKTLKTANGENLVIIPPVPYQSEVEWIGLMKMQDKYDVIITNTLVVKDMLQTPYPHTICKHGKVGGQSYSSPARNNLNGKAVMVSILENYGEIQGIMPNHSNDITREMNNKILGGYYLAHEIGHALFHLTDVYDHGDSCLMNPSKTNEDNMQEYIMLTKDAHPCPKCLPMITNQTNVIKAIQKEKDKLFNDAADLYLTAAEDPLFKGIEKYANYVDYLYMLACKTYTLAGNANGKKASCKE